jgi:transposase InsO family protein
MVRHVRRTAMLPKVRELWRLSERRACAVLDNIRKALLYRPVKRDESVLRTRIKEIAWDRIRYGYKRIAVLLRRDGWMVNHKRVRRPYREENLHNSNQDAQTPARRLSARGACCTDRAKSKLGHGLHARRARRRHEDPALNHNRFI